MGRIRPKVAIALLVLSTVACGPADEPATVSGATTSPVAAPMTTTTSSTARPSSSVAPSTTAGPPADPAALPLCGDIRWADSGALNDCRLVSHDRAGLTFVTWYRKSAPDSAKPAMTVQVIGRDGKVRQTIVETGTDQLGIAPSSAPELLDLAGDGRDQLVIPVYRGIVNGVFAVYRATDAAPDFVRSGVVSGISVDRSEDGAYIIGDSREGPGKYWYGDFWQFAGSQLKLVGATKTELNEDHRSTCGVNDEYAQQHPELMDVSSAQRFCAVKRVRTKAVQ